MYVQLNALQLVLDPRSLVWINLFALDLRQSLEQFMEIYKLSDSQKPDEHVDIKVDGLMLKVCWNSEGWTRDLCMYSLVFMWFCGSFSPLAGDSHRSGCLLSLRSASLHLSADLRNGGHEHPASG